MADTPSVWAESNSIPAVRPQTFAVIQTLTAIQDQTVFIITAFTYTPNTGTLRIYVNGSRLTGIRELSGNSFGLPIGCKAKAGDLVLVEALLEEVGTVLPSYEATKYVASEGDVKITVSGIAKSMFVFRNGSNLTYPYDFTGNTENTELTLTNAAMAGDVFNIFYPTAVITGESLGDMQTAVYDPPKSGIVNAARTVPWSGVSDKPDLSSLHTHSNKATLDAIGQNGGLPTWNGGAWPGSGSTGTWQSQIQFQVAGANQGGLGAITKVNYTGAVSASLSGTELTVNVTSGGSGGDAMYKATYDPANGARQVAFADTVTTAIAAKQDTLVSGTNIKTINGSSILGSGNLAISGGSAGQDTLLDWTSGAVTFTSSNTTSFPYQVVELTTGIYLALYYNSGFKARVITVSGTTPTAGAEQSLWANPTNTAFSVAVLSATSVVVSYVVSGDMGAVALTISGNTVTPGTFVPIGTGSSVGTSGSQIVGAGGSKFILTGLNAANAVYAVGGSVSGNTVTLGTYATGGPAAQACRLGFTGVADTAVLEWSNATTTKVTVLSLTTLDVTFNNSVDILNTYEGGSIYISKLNGVYTGYIPNSNTVICHHFTVAGTVPSLVGRSVMMGVSSTRTFQWVIENSNGKGVGVVGTAFSGTSGAAYRVAASMAQQPMSSFVRETAGPFVGSTAPSAPVCAAGASATKLALHGTASTTLTAQILTERNI